MTIPASFTICEEKKDQTRFHASTSSIEGSTHEDRRDLDDVREEEREEAIQSLHVFAETSDDATNRGRIEPTES